MEALIWKFTYWRLNLWKNEKKLVWKLENGYWHSLNCSIQVRKTGAGPPTRPFSSWFSASMLLVLVCMDPFQARGPCRLFRGVQLVAWKGEERGENGVWDTGKGVWGASVRLHMFRPFCSLLSNLPRTGSWGNDQVGGGGGTGREGRAVRQLLSVYSNVYMYYSLQSKLIFDDHIHCKAN